MADLFEDSDCDDIKENSFENDEFKSSPRQKYKEEDIDPFKLEREYENRDKDIELFIENGLIEEKEVIDPKYNDIIQGVIKQAKKQLKSNLDIEARHNRQVERVQQYHFSRAYLIMQIGRCLKIVEQKFGFCSELILAQLISIMLSSKDLEKKKLGKYKPKELILLFNK